MINYYKWIGKVKSASTSNYIYDKNNIRNAVLHARAEFSASGIVVNGIASTTESVKFIDTFIDNKRIKLINTQLNRRCLN